VGRGRSCAPATHDLRPNRAPLPEDSEEAHRRKVDARAKSRREGCGSTAVFLSGRGSAELHGGSACGDHQHGAADALVVDVDRGDGGCGLFGALEPAWLREAISRRLGADWGVVHSPCRPQPPSGSSTRRDGLMPAKIHFSNGESLVVQQRFQDVTTELRSGVGQFTRHGQVPALVAGFASTVTHVDEYEVSDDPLIDVA
jgi:hypothetical protein